MESLNRPFAHYRFDSKILSFMPFFYKIYFSYDKQTGTRSSKSNAKTMICFKHIAMDSPYRYMCTLISLKNLSTCKFIQ